SPEGHAWLVAQNGVASDLRVLDPFDPSAETTDSLELGSLSRLQAWSEMDAAAIADDSLWQIDHMARVQLAPPTGFSADAELCGDPTTNGALLYGGELVERREDDQWWGWNPGTTGNAAPSQLLRFQGECAGPDDNVWMTSPDGTLWRVEPASVYRPVRFEGYRSAAITSASGSEVMIGVLAEDRLWAGASEWQPYTFDRGTPELVSAAGGALWTVVDDHLLRFDGTTWNEIGLPDGASGIDGVEAHAGGAWLTAGDQVCHVALGPMLRVTGIRPYLRSKELDYTFTVASDDAGATISASLDGESLTLSDDGVSVTGKARLDEVGWHELVVAAGETERSIFVKRIPEEIRSWAEDVEPIYQANCTGSDCHVAGGSATAPDLSTYETWTALAAKIRTRVVVAKTMPPTANQGPDWGEEQVAIIAQWLEGGMAP
ncbi:MAG: cytochrome c, partial [Myxococcales bacterium]|nr:cytochrome c [Myxococcales bacterium]